MSWKTMSVKFLSVSTPLILLATEALANPNREDGGGYGSAPEIDGPAGIAAIALLVSVGLVAYNRYRK